MAFNPNEHMMNLKGKDYLQVMWRLVWFREEHPDFGISSVALELTEDHAIFRTVITDASGNPVSCGHGSESKRDFGDFIEKAETKAVGRALAMFGYGTQFAADELDEGTRIVDSPVQRKKQETPEPVHCEACGKEIDGYVGKGGKPIPIATGVAYSKTTFGQVLCPECIRIAKATKKETA